MKDYPYTTSEDVHELIRLINEIDEFPYISEETEDEVVNYIINYPFCEYIYGLIMSICVYVSFKRDYDILGIPCFSDDFYLSVYDVAFRTTESLNRIYVPGRSHIFLREPGVDPYLVNNKYNLKDVCAYAVPRKHHRNLRSYYHLNGEFPDWFEGLWNDWLFYGIQMYIIIKNNIETNKTKSKIESLVFDNPLDEYKASLVIPDNNFLEGIEDKIDVTSINNRTYIHKFLVTPGEWSNIGYCSTAIGQTITIKLQKPHLKKIKLENTNKELTPNYIDILDKVVDLANGSKDIWVGNHWPIDEYSSPRVGFGLIRIIREKENRDIFTFPLCVSKFQIKRFELYDKQLAYVIDVLGFEEILSNYIESIFRRKIKIPFDENIKKTLQDNFFGDVEKLTHILDVQKLSKLVDYFDRRSIRFQFIPCFYIFKPNYLWGNYIKERRREIPYLGGEEECVSEPYEKTAYPKYSSSDAMAPWRRLPGNGFSRR